jgi:hypothetical protein
LFAFSPLVWRYAVGAEVFSLNNLFLALLVWLLVSFETDRRERTVYLFAFAFGLGLANHHTLLLCGVPIGLWMLVRARSSLFKPVPAVKLTGAGLAGLTPYLYLVLRPSDSPLTTWGDSSTFDGLLTHVTRAEYGTLRLAATERSADLGENLLDYAMHLPRELLWVGIPLALLALPLVRGDELRARVLRVLLVALATYVLVFYSLSNMPLDDPLFREVHSRFAQQANLIACVLAGTGFWWLFRLRLGWSPAWVAVAAVGLVGLQAGVGYSAANQRDNRVIADLARLTLDRMPPGALVVSRGDLFWNSLRYVQIGEDRRPDVRLLDMEMLEAPWFNEMVRAHLDDVRLPGAVYRTPGRARERSYDLLRLFEANGERFPLFSNGLDSGDSSWAERFSAWPVGFFDRLHAAGTPVDVESYLAETDAWVERVRVVLDGPHPPGSWEALAAKQLVEFEGRRGTQLLSHAVVGGLRPDQLRRTGRILERALELDENAEPALWLNMGIYYYLARGEEDGAVENMVRVFGRYLELAPDDDPQRRMVQRVLEDPADARLGIGAR